MKISVDDIHLFTLSNLQKQVIQHNIPSEIFEEDMKRRVHWVLSHKYERCLERLKTEWIPRLKAKGIPQIPLDDDALCELIFSQPEYKSRSEREATES